MGVEHHCQGVYGRADSSRVARGLVDEPAGVESDRIGEHSDHAWTLFRHRARNHADAAAGREDVRDDFGVVDLHGADRVASALLEPGRPSKSPRSCTKPRRSYPRAAVVDVAPNGAVRPGPVKTPKKTRRSRRGVETL